MDSETILNGEIRLCAWRSLVGKLLGRLPRYMGIVTPENISAHVPLEVRKTAGLCILMIQSMVHTIATFHGIFAAVGRQSIGNNR